MKAYAVKLIDKRIAKELIVENHYSHKWSSCRYALGLFEISGARQSQLNLVGVAVYGFPVGRQVVKSITADMENCDVLELTRLWLRDEEPKNSESYFLGQTFQWLRNNTIVKVLISYSDPMYGHTGVIYQATNWMYQGNNTMLIRGHLHVIHGETMHPRSVVAKYGTVRTSELKKIDPDYYRIELKKKHRYLYVLRRKDRKSILSKLKHAVVEYPKDNSNCSWGRKQEICIIIPAVQDTAIQDTIAVQDIATLASNAQQLSHDDFKDLII
ncbi:hypothetical protein LCGC14_0378240 [marine sediment metagenome]|uniref:Uncharacterized protein n=1 Tax=marine sediment metagenome TaxID=412755 RepID=A0A0F9T337_9ZZZZ